MGRINWGSVILCGLLTGLVLNVVDGVLYGVVLKADLDAAMTALNRPAMANSAMVWFVVCDFLFGIYFMWLYAAIRPRFGAGPRTALIAGLAMWVLFGVLHWISEEPMGLFPAKIYVIGLTVALIQYPVSVMAGAKFYKEA